MALVILCHMLLDVLSVVGTCCFGFPNTLRHKALEKCQSPDSSIGQPESRQDLVCRLAGVHPGLGCQAMLESSRDLVWRFAGVRSGLGDEATPESSQDLVWRIAGVQNLAISPRQDPARARRPFNLAYDALLRIT